MIEAIKKAIKRHSTPEIINSTQFVSDEYINLLKENKIKIFMDGKGRALDNQCIERFFRSYKWEKLTNKSGKNLFERFIFNNLKFQ